MLQDMTAKELATIRTIRHKELIGNDRRDMLLAKAFACVIRSNGCEVGFEEIVKALFPIEIPRAEQTPEQIAELLSAISVKPDGTEHSNPGGQVHGGHVGA